MPRPLDARLDRVEGKRMAAAAERSSEAIRRRSIWRAEAAMGAVVRSALARAGMDPAGVARLRLADEAAAALAAIPDTRELQRADAKGAVAADAHDRASADAFASKIEALAERLAGAPPPDLANASFAELFAWSLAQPGTE
jgi:hypothetical protein